MAEKWRNWTKEALKKYAIFNKNIKLITFQRRWDYLMRLEKKYGVYLHSHPDEIYKGFQQYVMEMRGKYGDEADNRIRNMKNAVNLLFSFFGVASRYEWPRTREIKPQIVLPREDVVYAHIHGQNLHPDRYYNLLINYISNLAYVLGPRPRAIAGMKVSGVIYDTNTFIYYEPKVMRYRRVVLPDFVIKSPVDKSLKNWIEHHRAKVANRHSGDYLWLKKDGRPWDPEKLRLFLTKHCKKVDSSWHPYLYRHYAATRFLVEGYKKFGVMPIYELKTFMDHDKIENTFRYVHLASEIIGEMQRNVVGRIHKRNVKKNWEIKVRKMLKKPYLRDFTHPAGPMKFFSGEFVDNTSQNIFIDFTEVRGWFL